jgi:hypothetical protein
MAFRVLTFPHILQVEVTNAHEEMVRPVSRRSRADDEARALDLEDGSAMINAKLGTIRASWKAETGVDHVAYQLDFYETS